jgi:hypothetical protein
MICSEDGREQKVTRKAKRAFYMYVFFCPLSSSLTVSATCGCRLSRREGAETEAWCRRTVLVQA